MHNIHLRDLDGLTPMERASRHIERLVGETSGLLQDMASRARNRQIRAAMDEEENFSDDDQRMPILPDGEVDKQEPEGPVQSVRLQGDGEAA